MFTRNTTHQQTYLFGLRDSLPEPKRKKLLTSKEYAIYELVFSRIDETIFSPLFSETYSRPNAPINSIVTSMILQQNNGWTDEKLFSHIEFDILTRAALGLDSLDENPFCPATFYNFKNRLLRHHLETQGIRNGKRKLH